MKTVMQISLSGHSTMFQLDEDAYAALQAYLDRARARLKRDPDREEVLRDLEQSIGEKFVGLLRSELRVIKRNEVDAVLAQIGAVETGNGDAPAGETRTDQTRRLCRIQEGQWIAGVCEGLAAYSSIDVAWVRTIFILLSVCTGGIPILVYIVLMFVLPIARTHDDYVAMQSHAA